MKKKASELCADDYFKKPGTNYWTRVYSLEESTNEEGKDTVELMTDDPEPDPVTLLADEEVEVRVEKRLVMAGKSKKTVLKQVVGELALRELVEGRVSVPFSDHDIREATRFFEELVEKLEVLGPTFELAARECRRQIGYLDTLSNARATR